MAPLQKRFTAADDGPSSKVARLLLKGPSKSGASGNCSIRLSPKTNAALRCLQQPQSSVHNTCSNLATEKQHNAATCPFRWASRNCCNGAAPQSASSGGTHLPIANRSKPSQTASNLLTPSETVSNCLNSSQTVSSRLKPAQTVQTVSNRLKPLRTLSNRSKLS